MKTESVLHRASHFALRFVGAAALVAALDAPPLRAAEPEKALALDEVVVSATRTERKIDETPGTVTAVTLDSSLTATLQDLVRGETLVSVPFSFSGAGVAYQRSGANSINIRGIEGNRVLQQVDGVRVPDEFRLGGSEPIGRDYFDPALFNRLEILQGSASALYGSDALGGVVTFTTKSPDDFLRASKNFFSSASATYGSADDSWAFVGTAAARAGNVRALVVYSRRDGHERDNRGTVAANPEDFSSDAVLTKLVWSPTPAQRVEGALEFFDRSSTTEVNNKEVTSGTTTTTGLSIDSRTKRFRLSASYTLDGQLANIAAFDRLEARIYWQDANTTDLARERITYSPASAANGSFRNRDITTAFNNDTVGFSVAAVKSLGSNHRLAYGVEGSRTDTDKPWRSVTINAFGTTYPSEPRMAVTETDRLGAYLQDEFVWRVSDEHRLTLIPGVRVDQFKLSPENSPAYLAVTAGQSAPSFDEVAVTPKLGAMFNLTNTLNVYAQYNRGFRYPTAEDLTATFTNPTSRYRTVPNPNLKEETSNSYEVGLKGQPIKGLTVRTAIFYNDYKNFIEQIATAPAAFQDFVNWPSGTFQTQNRAKARIWGAEVWARADLGVYAPGLRGFSFVGSVGKTRGEYEAAGITSRLTTVEPLKAFAQIGYDAANRRYGFSFSSEHAASGQPGTGTQFVAPSYTTLDAGGYWRATDALVLRLGLYNLTDKKYWRYSSVRGVTTTQYSEQERRSETGFNVAASVLWQF